VLSQPQSQPQPQPQPLVEALADAVSLEQRELLGSAKDLGSAAVGLTLLLAVACWAVVLWRVWGR
jgi:diacylglycerol kinase (ATP)